MGKIIGLIAFVLCSSGAIAGDYYGAIAFSTATGYSGTSYNWPNRAQAEYEALAACKKADCKVVAWVKNACAALAVGQNRGYGWSWNTDLDNAEERALVECSNVTMKCRVQARFCSKG